MNSVVEDGEKPCCSKSLASPPPLDPGKPPLPPSAAQRRASIQPSPRISPRKTIQLLLKQQQEEEKQELKKKLEREKLKQKQPWKRSVEVLYTNLNYEGVRSRVCTSESPLLQENSPRIMKHAQVADVLNQNKSQPQQDVNIISNEDAAKLQEQIGYLHHHSGKANLNANDTNESEIPTLPPMVDLLRCSHQELINRLVAAHKELYEIKKEEGDSTTTSPKNSRAKPSKVKGIFVRLLKKNKKGGYDEVDPCPRTKLVCGKDACTVTSNFNIGNGQEMVLNSYFKTQATAATSVSGLTLDRVTSSPLAIYKNRNDFASQLYQDAKNMNGQEQDWCGREITIIDHTERGTISTAEMVHSSYSELMRFVEEQSDICLKPTTSALDPLETMLLNDRTMKHILLYMNPKYQLDMAKILPENVRPYKKRCGPTIYDVRNYIPPGIAVTCFEESEMDLELKQIFKQCPPVTHEVYTRKISKKWKDSVPGIDSFYGTWDLKKFGHPSYFMPSLTPYQREIMGWQPKFRHGKRKYPSDDNLFRSIGLPKTLTFCEFVAHLNDPPDPYASTSPSLESFEKGPRICGYSFKEVNKKGSFLEGSTDKILNMKHKRKTYGFQRFMNRILPCWWKEPPPDEEDWQQVDPQTPGQRILKSLCGCCMEEEPAISAHDIVISEDASGEFLTTRPPRIMKPVKPGPRHRNRWFLPRPSPLPQYMTWEEYRDMNGNPPPEMGPPRYPFTPEAAEPRVTFLRLPSELNI